MYLENHTMVICSVDELTIFAKTVVKKDDLKRRLSADLLLKYLAEPASFLGIHIERKNEEMSLSQNGFVAKLFKKTKMSDYESA